MRAITQKKLVVNRISVKDYQISNGKAREGTSGKKTCGLGLRTCDCGGGGLNAIVDEDGELVKTFDYEEFGGPHPASVGQIVDPNNQNAANNQLKFAGGVGHLTDDSGLIYMRARYYDPASGRFISEDPGRNGTNWYAYCGNNPVNMVDPTGQMGLMSTIVTSDLTAYLCYVLAAAFLAWIWYEAVEGNLGNPHGGEYDDPWSRGMGWDDTPVREGEVPEAR